MFFSCYYYTIFSKFCIRSSSLRVKKFSCTESPKLSAESIKIFDCYVIREWDAAKVQDRLGVSMSQVYLAKHRVGKILKKELARLNEDAG